MDSLKNKNWKGTKNADTKTFEKVVNSAINMQSGADILTIGTLQNSTVNLGADDDTLTITTFVTVTNALGFEYISSLDGGTGIDRLILKREFGSFKWIWLTSDLSPAGIWLLQGSNDTGAAKVFTSIASVTNFEIVNFSQNISAQLGQGSMTVQGTDASDRIEVYADAGTQYDVRAGLGDDTVQYSGGVGDFVSLIDGGQGNDVFALTSKKANYQFIRNADSSHWFVQTKDDNGYWINAVELVNIESATFADRPNPEKISGTVVRAVKNSTVSGMPGNDTISVSNDVKMIDLTSGGNDTITFSAANYAFGTTSVTVLGFGQGDSFVFQDLPKIAAPTPINNPTPENNFLSSQIVHWYNNATLIVNYMMPSQ